MTIAKRLFINYVDNILVIYDHLPTLKLIFLIFIIENQLTVVGPQPTHPFFQRTFWMTSSWNATDARMECLKFSGKLVALILILFEDKDTYISKV